MLHERFRQLGYVLSPQLEKVTTLIVAETKQNPTHIPGTLLRGLPGSGKTFYAETFARAMGWHCEFIQCYPGMDVGDFLYDVDIAAVLRQDSDRAVVEGVLVKALRHTHQHPTVLVVDEIDKARPEVDAFFLDFLNSGRISTGRTLLKKGPHPLVVFFTSNDERDLSDPLLNRLRKVVVERPGWEVFAKAVGGSQQFLKRLRTIYKSYPSFSIRQAKRLRQDLETLGVDWDSEIAAMYLPDDPAGTPTSQVIEVLEIIRSLSRRIYELETMHGIDSNDDIEIEHPGYHQPVTATEILNKIKQQPGVFVVDEENAATLKGTPTRATINDIDKTEFEFHFSSAKEFARFFKENQLPTYYQIGYCKGYVVFDLEIELTFVPTNIADVEVALLHCDEKGFTVHRIAGTPYIALDDLYDYISRMR